MRDSDAKIKIYMHQDVFIADKDFLLKLLEIFDSDSHIGMVGMVGAVRLYAPRSVSDRGRGISYQRTYRYSKG